MGNALHIGKREITSRVLVAPMSGVSDLPFRRVLQRYRPGYVVSEMVAGKELCEGNADTELRAAGAGEIDPLVIQLVGNEADWMARGAERSEALGADIIDINMGCPARKVTTGLSGSALMRDLDHAAQLIGATVDATSRPVTLKMRLGWDHESLNASDLARRAEDLGVQLVTVHGRTRQQFYEGIADWGAVRPVSEAVSIPVVVNGDIHDAATARQALEESGADAVMVGRNLVGRPWQLATIMRGLGETPAIPAGTPPEIAVAHFDDTLDLYGEGRGIRVFRKHLQAYLQHAGLPSERARPLLRSFDASEVRDGLGSALERSRAA